MILHIIPRLLGTISPRLLPPGWHDLKEPYDVAAMVRSQTPEGKNKFWAILPPWMRKLLSGNRRFWTYTPSEIERHLEGRQMTEEADNVAAELRQKERDDMRNMLGIGVTVTEREVQSMHYDPERGSPTTSYDMENKGPQTPMANPDAFKA